MAVEGVKELRAALKRFEADVAKEARRVTAKAIGRIQADAKRRCPVGTGDGPFKGHVRDQIFTQLHVSEPYGAVFVERRGIGGKYGTDNVAIWLEYGTKKMGARPFLRPAAEADRQNYYNDLRDSLDRLAREFS